MQEPENVDESKSAVEKANKKLQEDVSRERRVESVSKRLRDHNEFGAMWDRVLKDKK